MGPMHASDLRCKQLSRTMTDLSKAIDLGRQALDLCPSGHPNRSMFLNSAAIRYSIRYQSLGEMTDLCEAIVLGQQALDLCSPENRNRSMYLNNVASYLSDRYKWLGEVTDLDEAIVLAQQALDISPPGHPSHSVYLNSVATHLSDRYKRTGDMADLEEAIILTKQALVISPPGHPSHSVYLNSVATHLSRRHKHLGETTDLNEAIVLGRQVLDASLRGCPNRLMYLDSLATYLSDRYERFGELSDLQEAIILAQKALEISPLWRPNRSVYLTSVATCLSNRYQRLGEVTDLDEAIVLGRQALDLRPPGHTDRATTLNVVANCLFYRYQQLGEMGDLDEAIVLGDQALQGSPSGHPDRPMYLSGVAAYLSNRYRWLGKMADLNEAVVLGRGALDVSPARHPKRSFFLSSVATCLSDRYKRLGDLVDLDEAILLGRQALDLCSPGNPDLAINLNVVANCLSSRYQQLGKMEDLDRAIVLGRKALDICPSGHIHHSVYMNGLAAYLSDQHKKLGELTDLNEAIILGQQALDISPLGCPNRSVYLTNVAMYLSDRFKLLGDMADLNEAIFLGQKALNLRPPGHLDRSQSLDQLASYLHIRFTHSNESQDKENVFNLYTELAHVPRIISLSDIFSAKKWVSMAEDSNHPTTLLAYETSLQLLTRHLAMLPPLPRHLQVFKDLASSLAFDAFSACLRGQRAKTAVELLEQGRGVFWNQISRLRSPLEKVVAAGPAGKHLADDFTSLTSHIHDAINSDGSDPGQRDRLCCHIVDLEAVIADIRKLPGLARFLLPSLFSDLQHAARGGPVIIVNASQYTCDALIIFLDRDPVHVPLQVTKPHLRVMTLELQSLTLRAKSMVIKNDLVQILRALWDEVVSPIVDFLQTTVPLGSRIWWCPTAEFSLLPLHAAGPFRKGQRNLSHLYISSYTSTLAALIRATRFDSRMESSIKEKRFLAVGQAGGSFDDDSEMELDNVAERMQGLSTITRLRAPESTISRVSDELKKNEWVHFVCGSILHRQWPFTSAFGLHDGRFTIEHIVRNESHNSAEFAYLSACQTMVGDQDSPDEAINLASAIQFAGFRSVIGTMWAVESRHAHTISSIFYKHMVDESGHLDHTRAAFALNKTIKSVGSSIPLEQRILYIHLGA